MDATHVTWLIYNQEAIAFVCHFLVKTKQSRILDSSTPNDSGHYKSKFTTRHIYVTQITLWQKQALTCSRSHIQHTTMLANKLYEGQGYHIHLRSERLVEVGFPISSVALPLARLVEYLLHKPTSHKSSKVSLYNNSALDQCT